MILFFVFICGFVVGAATLIVYSLAVMAGETSRDEDKLH